MTSTNTFDTTIRQNKKTLDYEIVRNGFSWVSEGRKAHVILRRKVGRKFAYTYRSFQQAKNKTFESTSSSVVTTYSGFSAFGKTLPFTLICKAEILENGKVTFTVRAENETDMDIEAVYFPSPFNAKNDGDDAYTVDTMHQGLLAVNGHKENWLSLFLLTKYWRKVNSADCYMPFWGRVSKNHGYCAIIETPYDANLFSCYGKKQSLLTSVNWRSSLGKLSYERRLTFTFFDKGDYNTVAKIYRNYLKENGDLLTLNEKIKRNQKVQNMVGTPVLHTSIYTNIHPSSNYYKKGEENDFIHATFEERAEQYAHLKKLGLNNLYIHTDGWGEKGYDNNHPYILPPAKKAGGYNGMKKLADTCKDLNYTFALHDQYRDYYFSSKKYNETHAVENIDGSNPYCDIWAGGPHTWLCTSKALDYVKTTYTELEEHGVFVGGVYLDVFSIVPGDECFNPDHRITREESMQYRRECFDYLMGKGIITSSEEPGSQIVNSIALVHHAAYAVRPQDGGQGVGISVPLANLVYHDCVLTPWVTKGTGGWGIPDGDSAKLHCILNAGLPYFEPFDSEDNLLSDSQLKIIIAEMNEITDIQKELYNKEMVSHSFVNGNKRIQQTIYDDGTNITVDFDKNEYTVTKQ